MVWKPSIGGLALVLALAHCAQAETISKSVPSGQSSKIDHFTGWNDDCSFKSLNIDIVSKPSHGQVTSRIASGVIPPNAKTGSSGSCAGKPTKVLEVYYRPEKGFHGSDSFTVNMSFGGPGTYFYYTVTVQ